MGIESELSRAASQLAKVKHELESVRMCANFIRKHDEAGRPQGHHAAGGLDGPQEHERLVRQLLAAEDRLFLEAAKL